MYLLKDDGMHRLPSTAIGLETFELLLQVGDSIHFILNLLFFVNLIKNLNYISS